MSSSDTPVAVVGQVLGGQSVRDYVGKEVDRALTSPRMRQPLVQGLPLALRCSDPRRIHLAGLLRGRCRGPWLSCTTAFVRKPLVFSMHKLRCIPRLRLPEC